MPSQTSLAEIHTENYRFLQEHVYSQSGIVLEKDKHYLFESRLTPIVRQLGLGTINDLCALLMATQEADISRQVVEAMTTNETYFFRDPSHYEAIRAVLLPRLKQERQDVKKLRFWSAAASTGQEAYSLAMALLEDGLSDWNIQILGTDFSSQVLERDPKTGAAHFSHHMVLTYHFIEKGSQPPVHDAAWDAYVKQYMNASSLKESYVTCVPSEHVPISMK